MCSGLLAATIDIVANWLGDLKFGYCSTGFYLNKDFCCWGLEDGKQCTDWKSWPVALHSSSSASQYILSYIFYVIYACIFGTAASFLVLEYAPYASQSGIPEMKTILSGFNIPGFMGFWTLIVKSLSLCLAAASALWLGKEGPLVHVACCCANIAMRSHTFLRENEARKREIFSAAAAAGITVAFGSPVGGVLFSLEQVSYYFPDRTMWQSFVCAMVGSVVIQVRFCTKTDLIFYHCI